MKEAREEVKEAREAFREAMKAEVATGDPDVKTLRKLADDKLDAERDAAYLIVQRNAMRTWAGEGSFRDLLGADEELTDVLDAKQLDGCFQPERFLSHVDEIYGRVFDE